MKRIQLLVDLWSGFGVFKAGQIISMDIASAERAIRFGWAKEVV